MSLKRQSQALTQRPDLPRVVTAGWTIRPHVTLGLAMMGRKNPKILLALVLLTYVGQSGCGSTVTNVGPAGADSDHPTPPRTASTSPRTDRAVAPASSPSVDAEPPPGTDCFAIRLGDFKRANQRTVNVRYFPVPIAAVVFEAGLAIDADGGPHAYKDDDKGLDTYRNACPKDPGQKCYGILERTPGDKVRQAAPNQAYYISPTTLVDRDNATPDQARYVNAETINYLALPLKTLNKMASEMGAAPPVLGDLAFVRNRSNGKTAYALFADVGPADKIGEGSIALAAALGIPSSPRHGGTRDGVEVVVFPGSGNHRPKPQQAIDREGAARLASWGGEARLRDCGAR